MNRRRFLVLTAGTLTLPAVGALRASAAARLDPAAIEALQRQWRDLVPPGADLPLSPEPLQRSKAEWRRRLGQAAYKVLFEEGTERPFTSPLNDEKRPGLYVCAACDLPLFTSAMKYDSGTGWPSFFTCIPEHLGTKLDFSLIWPRTEYHCRRCGGHQGHVFNDGPPPTGERWCNNGVALRFLPLDPGTPG